MRVQIRDDAVLACEDTATFVGVFLLGVGDHVIGESTGNGQQFDTPLLTR